MRTTTLTVHNNQSLEIFKRRRGDSGDGFEVWMVGNIKGRRTVLDHFITSEDYESFLRYAEAGDVLWQDAEETSIPSQKTKVAEEMEEVVKRGTHINDAVLCCYNASHQLSIDRKAWNAAKSSLIGQWTDDTATLVFELGSKFQLISDPNALPAHPICAAVRREGADWWGFSRWHLFLMNNAEKRGHKIGVWRCDEHELHILSQKAGSLVHVFRRI